MEEYKENEKNNDERGGGRALSISVKFCCCSCACVCFGVVGCLCCCHHGPRVLIFLRFSTDSSPPSSLDGAGGMMSSEPCVSTTRRKIASPTECAFSQTCASYGPF